MPDIDFQLKLSNVNWSRPYQWKVQLHTTADDLINGAKLYNFSAEKDGLPVIDVQDNIAYGEEFSWETGAEPLYVPQRKSKYEISITTLDDEDGTLELFFEYWFNLVYNQVDEYGLYRGVLPLDKACRRLTITKMSGLLTTIYTRDYYVFPIGTLMGSNKSDTSAPRQYNIQFRVANYVNPSFTGRARVWTDVIEDTVNKYNPFN